MALEYTPWEMYFPQFYKNSIRKSTCLKLFQRVYSQVSRKLPATLFTQFLTNMEK